MAKESIEDQLLKSLEEQTEPHYAWRKEGVKKEIQKGTAAIRANVDYTAEKKGPEIIAQFEALSTDLYTVMGREGNGNPKMLAHHLRTALGEENYLGVKESLKIGDVDEAIRSIKNALRGEVEAAQLGSTLEKIALLAPEARIKFGKDAVKRIGGTDYVTAATNPAQFVGLLKQQKAIADHYDRPVFDKAA